jgi:hypothetical protein
MQDLDTKMSIDHDTHAMQNMHNWKAIHMLQKGSHHQLKKPNTHQVLPANEGMLLYQGAW